MAIIGAVIGAGAIVGIINHGSYGDHSDYSNYGNYSDYSDAEERRRLRMEAKEAEIKTAVQDVNQYKINQVNAYLKNRTLIATPGETVPLIDVMQDGNGKINIEETQKIAAETSDIQQELNEIDSAIAAIDSILEEKKQ